MCSKFQTCINEIWRLNVYNAKALVLALRRLLWPSALTNWVMEAPCTRNNSWDWAKWKHENKLITFTQVSLMCFPYTMGFVLRGGLGNWVLTIRVRNDPVRTPDSGHLFRPHLFSSQSQRTSQTTIETWQYSIWSQPGYAPGLPVLPARGTHRLPAVLRP